MVKPAFLQRLFPYEAHYFKLKNGEKIHYVDEGSGEILLLLHGNPTWSFFYREIINHFRNKFRVIALDHVGMGFSSRPANPQINLTEHVENLKQFIQEKDLKDISLVVHDWGGAIGLGYATQYPENIKKLVILNTSVFDVEKIPWRIRLCRVPILGSFLIKKLNLFAGSAVHMSTTKKLNPEVAQGFLFPYRKSMQRQGINQFVKDIPLESNHPTRKKLHEIYHGLPKLKMPKLILWGGEDFCFTTYFYHQWKTIFPEAKTVLMETAGHYLLEDEPIRSVTVLEQFL